MRVHSQSLLSDLFGSLGGDPQPRHQGSQHQAFAKIPAEGSGVLLCLEGKSVSLLSRLEALETKNKARKA